MLVSLTNTINDFAGLVVVMSSLGTVAVTIWYVLKNLLPEFLTTRKRKASEYGHLAAGLVTVLILVQFFPIWMLSAVSGAYQGAMPTAINLADEIRGDVAGSWGGSTIEVNRQATVSDESGIPYLIQAGDTKESIANDFGLPVGVIDAILNGDIRAGDIVYFPQPTGGRPTTSSSPALESKPERVQTVDEDGDYTTYIVKSNDTLEKIAIRFGTTVEELSKLNGIRNPNLVIAGASLKVPS